MSTSKEIKDLEQAHKELGDKIEALKVKKETTSLIWYKDQPVTHDNFKRYTQNELRLHNQGRTSRSHSGLSTLGYIIGDKTLPDYDAENIITWIPNTGCKPSLERGQLCVALRADGELLDDFHANRWTNTGHLSDITHYTIIKPPIKFEK